MKILLMTPTWPIELRTHKKLKSITTETELLGLAYLAAYLQAHGYQVEISDFFVEKIGVETLQEYMKGKSYDLIGITTFTPSMECVRENVKTLRELYPLAVIGLGGAHVTAMKNVGRAHDVLEDNPAVDFCVFGEGEVTLLEIVSRLEKGTKDFSDIPGVIWRKNNTYIENIPRDLIGNLDEIPFPAYDLLPLEKYKRTPSSYKREPVRSVLLSRGCSFQCIFCDRGAFGHKIRRRSIANIYSELLILTQRYGTREIRIWDDVFTLDSEFVVDFCNMIKPFGLTWTCNARVNLITQEQAEKMKDAGCWAIDFGIESGNDRILKIIRKNFTVEQAKKSISIAKTAGLEVRAFFILGFPGETKETVNDTITFALEADIDYATFYLPQPYPGTELHRFAVEEGSLVYNSWNDFLIEGSTPTYVNPNFTSEQLTSYQTQAYRKFYRRAGYVWRHIKKIRSIDDIKRYIKAAAILKI